MRENNLNQIAGNVCERLSINDLIEKAILTCGIINNKLK